MTTTTVPKPPPWASRVTEALEAQHHTLAWLAEEIGVSRSLMTRLMHGERKPNRAQLRHIAQALGIPAHWLEVNTDSKPKAEGPQP